MDTGPANGWTPLVESVVSRLGEDAAGLDKESITDFCRAYLRRIPDPDAEGSDSWAGHVASMLEFIRYRSSPVMVRAFNPTVETHGYETAGTVLEVLIDDAPFLVDSVTNELQAHGLEVARVIHPVIGVERAADGELSVIGEARHTTDRESVQHYELDRTLFEGDLPGLDSAVTRVLEDVRKAVRDFHPLMGRVDRMIELVRIAATVPDAEISEDVEFLSWLRDYNFVFLGYREYKVVDTERGKAVQVVPDTGLGILSDVGGSALREPVLLEDLPPDLAARYESGDLLVVTKSNRFSTVHRRSKMDYVGVRLLGRDGATIGEARMLGLFTSKAYMEPASRIPVLRRKLNQILVAEDLIEGSHDHKAVIQLFDGFSKHDLFAAPIDDLRSDLMALLALQERQQVRMFVRRDLLERSVSILVSLPRDQFNAALRHQLQDLFMARFGGSSVDYHLALGESESAQIHFTVWIEDGVIPEVHFDELEAEVIALARSWKDKVVEELATRMDRSTAVALADRWCDLFPDYYRTSTEPAVVVGDILRLDELAHTGGDMLVGMQNEQADAAGERLTRVALYRKGPKRPLTELVPALEDMGLVVVEEVPTRLAGEDYLFIHDFGVRGPTGDTLDVGRCGHRVTEALQAVWSGTLESDGLHRLIVVAGLSYAQVQILRAYRTYWRRVAPVFTMKYVNETLTGYPDLAAALVRLFELRFDPARDSVGYEAMRAEFLTRLDDVPVLDHDRILRSFQQMIDATQRTNLYRPDRRCLSFKIRSGDVPDMPAPVPMAEIFVMGDRMEGVHLRAGPVARGGIRWSDRREDYRTEVLGLMKAQMTKNAVIVPDGAKGGFVLYDRPDNIEDLKRAVRDKYEIFIRGLLDVTDNRVGDRIEHPPAVRVHDGEDPYFVVAADRGTATFSDVANGIAGEYGFWLGDAFASGGSSGYDHKQLGITAKGAWRSLERHFLELGIDPYRDQFTCVGIGDMSGDVFGNGMIQSDRIKLIAAFDHRHVFIDPDPDPVSSFEERKRLFELPGSSWADYDHDRISAGGGVWARSVKKVELSDEARRALGVDVRACTPAELVHLILQAPVDLLWNGGIGTYCKATGESHADAGDRANDAVRVDASELRCRVVVEGGNLGFTASARVEYALAGGRINTDFIDNSAGVDCSDREVNLKILLGLALSDGRLDLEARDRLIADAADAVVERILHDNFEQVQILSREERSALGRMDAYEEVIEHLEQRGILNRGLDRIPGPDEMRERARSGQPLSRPELAVLLVDAKRNLYESVVSSALSDDPYFLSELSTYFPAEVAEKCADLMAVHPLRREIVATMLANDVVNSEGLTFVHRMVSETGAEPDEVVRAYRVAKEVSGGSRRWTGIEGLFGKVGQAAWSEMMDEAGRLVGFMTRWYLARDAGEGFDSLSSATEIFGELEGLLPTLGRPEWRRDIEARVERMIDLGVPNEVATQHASASALIHAPDIIEVVRDTGRPVTEVAEVFFGAGQAVGLDRLETMARAVEANTPWQRWAIQTLEDDLVGIRRRLVDRVFNGAEGLAGSEAIDRFLLDRAPAVARLVRFMRSLENLPSGDLSPLLVASRQVAALAG